MLQTDKVVHKPHIVILGGGFAGMYTYKSLLKNMGARARYTIVSNSNHFLFTPLLHEVATGLLEAYHIVEPIRKLIRHDTTKFMSGTVKTINTQEKIVLLDSCSVIYDYLVIATGARSNFFNIKGADQYALPLKSLHDAQIIRDRCIESFEKALRANTNEERSAYLSFVVIGGGPTGVELAAEMADLCYRTFLSYYEGDIGHEEISITIVSSTPELVPMFAKSIRKASARVLARKGISIRLESKVVEVNEDKVTMADGATISTKNIFFTTGVTPNVPIFSGFEPPLTKSKRLLVDDTLRLIGTQNIFAIGDVATTVDELGGEIPMLAQAAVREGRYVGDAILRLMKNNAIKKFTFKLKGELLSLGEWNAAGKIAGISIGGPLAWFVWRTVYLSKFISPIKRIRIAFDWTIGIFTSRDIARITK